MRGQLRELRVPFADQRRRPLSRPSAPHCDERPLRDVMLRIENYLRGRHHLGAVAAPHELVRVLDRGASAHDFLAVHGPVRAVAELRLVRHEPLVRH
ncbi:hypothetical protein ACFPRL_27150 [Pseudoclavibacter helvolus]